MEHMPRRIIVGVIIAVGLVALGSASAASAAMCGVRTTAGTYRHVIVVFMENHSFSQIQTSSSTTYIHSLESSCWLAVNYHNITRPRLPTFIASTAGAPLAA